ncbi:M20/M25/M40 family metallo-hydrolase, partial [Thermoproteota archaeon]
DISNVVPGGAFFTLDFRQYEDVLYEEGKNIVANLVREVSEEHSLEYSLTQTVDVKPMRFDPGMTKLVERKSQELGLSHKLMHSGAGHDAQFMSLICPTALIFVPSIGGRSHCPEESTLKTDCINGANVLLNCVMELLMGFDPTITT